MNYGQLGSRDERVHANRQGNGLRYRSFFVFPFNEGDYPRRHRHALRSNLTILLSAQRALVLVSLAIVPPSVARKCTNRALFAVLYLLFSFCI